MEQNLSLPVLLLRLRLVIPKTIACLVRLDRVVASSCLTQDRHKVQVDLLKRRPADGLVMRVNHKQTGIQQCRRRWLMKAMHLDGLSRRLASSSQFQISTQPIRNCLQIGLSLTLMNTGRQARSTAPMLTPEQLQATKPGTTNIVQFVILMDQLLWRRQLCRSLLPI